LDFVKNEETLVAADAIVENSTIVEPCYIGPGAKIVGSTVGPYVSIGANSTVENSTLRDCIIGSHTAIMNITLHNSMIGQHAHIDGSFRALSLGDYSRLEG
jgi:glucose-1-phosphate thymidylyltransferase